MLSPLLSIELDGSAAGVFFDRQSPSPGVVGSGPGSDMAFSPLPGYVGDIEVIYDQPVNWAGSPHDLFSKVTMRFPGPTGIIPGLFPTDFFFTQDSDRAVPEPSAGMLLGIGLGLIGVRVGLRRYA